MNWTLILVGGIFGAVAGSAATALQDRYLRPRDFLVGRSECPQCKAQLRWFELLPIISWLLQAGRCRQCSKPIGWSTVSIELLAALLGAFLAFEFGGQPWLGILWIATIIFGALALVDLKDQLLPDKLLIAVVPFIIVVGWLAPSVQLTFLGAIEGSIVAGALLGCLWLITKGKGIGFGDVKLGAILGLGLGLQLSLVAIMAAFILGGGIASMLLVTRRAKLGQRISFGPFLIIGYYIALVAGPMILTWYSG